MSDLEVHIRAQCKWDNLPNVIKASMGNARENYDNYVLNFSIKNQLRWKTNLVREIVADERKYYDELIEKSRANLMVSKPADESPRLAKRPSGKAARCWGSVGARVLGYAKRGRGFPAGAKHNKHRWIPGCFDHAFQCLLLVKP
jgi:hypothetical protein